MSRSLERRTQLPKSTLLPTDVGSPVNQNSDFTHLDGAAGRTILARGLCGSAEIWTFGTAQTPPPSRRKTSAIFGAVRAGSHLINVATDRHAVGFVPWARVNDFSEQGLAWTAQEEGAAGETEPFRNSPP